MTFPRLQSVSSGFDDSNGTAYSVVLPAKVYPGQLLVVAIAFDGQPTITWDNTTFGTWTESLSTLSGTAVRFAVYSKVAVGNEGGGTLAVTTNNSEQAGWYCYCWADWQGTLANGLHVQTAATGTSTTPDSPDASPSWGAADNAWIAAFGHDGNVAVSAYPTNYAVGNANPRAATTGGAGVGVAHRFLNATSENPGAFTLGSEQWVATTIAVRGGNAGVFKDNPDGTIVAPTRQPRLLLRRARAVKEPRRKFRIPTGTPSVGPSETSHAHDLDTTTIAEHAAISPDEVGHGQALDTTDALPVGTLAPADTTHDQGLDSSSIAEHNVVAPAELAHAHALDASIARQPDGTLVAQPRHRVLLRRHRGVRRNPKHRTIERGKFFTAAELAHSHALDAATVAEHAAIAPADVGHAHSLETTATTEHSVAAPLDVGHEQSLDATDLTVFGILQAAELDHAQTLDAATQSTREPYRPVRRRRVPMRPRQRGFTVTIARTVYFVPTTRPTRVEHAHTLDEASIAEHTSVQPASLRHTAHELDTATLVEAAAVQPLDVDHEHTTDSGAIAPFGSVLPDDLEHQHALDVTAIAEHTTLTAPNLAHAHELEETVTAIRGELVPVELTQAHGLDESGLQQQGVLQPVQIDQAHALETSQLAEHTTLAPADAGHGHELEPASLAQTGVLSPSFVQHEHRTDTPALQVEGAISAAFLRHLHRLESSVASGDRFVVDGVLFVADASEIYVTRRPRP